jgi:hypothetical protein
MTRARSLPSRRPSPESKLGPRHAPYDPLVQPHKLSSVTSRGGARIEQHAPCRRRARPSCRRDRCSRRRTGVGKADAARFFGLRNGSRERRLGPKLAHAMSRVHWRSPRIDLAFSGRSVQSIVPDLPYDFNGPFEGEGSILRVRFPPAAIVRSNLATGLFCRADESISIGFGGRFLRKRTLGGGKADATRFCGFRDRHRGRECVAGAG